MREHGAIVAPSPLSCTSPGDQSIFRLKRFAFQTIRPVVSRKKRGFSAHFGSGGAVPPPRILPFSKAKCSKHEAAAERRPPQQIGKTDFLFTKRQAAGFEKPDTSH